MRQVYAHRGASGYAPENTLEAFALAVRQRAHGVELDVHLSRDLEVVVAHDETIDRVSDGSGEIRSMTLSELKRFSFGKAFPAYKDAAIPTLAEVFDLLRPSGLWVNVELKNGVIDYPGLEQKCVDLAEKTGMRDRLLFSSFNHHSLLRVKAIDPKLPCGLLYHATMVRPWAYAVALGMDALHPHWSELNIPGECESAHRAGLLVNPWTLNKEADIRFAFEAGADIVITNFPDRALEVLAALEKSR